MVPLCDLTLQYKSLQAEIDAAMQRVAAEARYILGPNVKAFESEVADYCGASHAVGVGNGTDALHLALRVLDIGPGDEVITTPFTFIATTEAIGLVGARPVFVDIDPATFNIDPEAVEAAVTPRTRAILPVHLYGQPCDMDAIMSIAGKHNLAVVEDCAQAIGATYKGRQVGTFGTAGCFSFFPSKNLGAMGDGGMVVTNDRPVYERVEMLRRHGGRVKYYHSEIGINSRLDELQAAILRVKLKHLESWCQLRRQHACRYNELLQNVPGVVCPAERSGRGLITPTQASSPNDLLQAVYHQYTLQVENRDQVQQELNKAGVGCLVYYPVPLHLQEVHANLGYAKGDFPNAEQVCQRCISLPMFPEMTQQQQQTVVDAIQQVLGRAASTGTLRKAA